MGDARARLAKARGITVLALVMIGALGAAPRATAITVTIDDRRPLRSFDPRVALGSTIDGHVRGSTDRIFTPANITAMRSANFGPISYRIRTELGIEAWHWNPRGRWSDSANAQGYWISDDRPAAPIRVSYGYRLPRRGSTTDQANNVGYSRLDDGDTATYWKSNPYLDQHYTGEPNGAHPQWAVIDLEARRPLNFIRILWGTPYAIRYEVQYWAGEDPRDFDEDSDDGGWRAFPRGRIANGAGGEAMIRLSDVPIHARFVRLLLLERSAPAVPSRDVRDDFGFAIREIYLGLTVSGHLRDALRHGTERGTGEDSQTRMTVSSTDPWHRATDRWPDTEQPGIDLVIESGVTKALPLLAPAGVLYDTPENAAALLRYLRARNYSVDRVELGEEPDGQYVSPDDFAALYLQVAAALHAVDPRVAVGGPSFQSAVTSVMMTWKSRVDETPWLTHFVNHLRQRGRLADLSFFSFEWYPFDDVCAPTAPQLARGARKLRGAIANFHADGLPDGVPLVLGEYGYSAFATRSQVDRAGALLNAETIGTFLAAGGSAAFLYGTEPAPLEMDPVHGVRCGSWGNNTMFVTDAQRRIRGAGSTHAGARMLTTEWADSTGGMHEMFATSAPAPVSAYTLRRPDGRWSVLLINKDSSRSASVQLHFASGAAMRAPLEIVQWGDAQYHWHADGPRGHAAPNAAPRTTLRRDIAPVVLPPYSLTVVREKLQP